MSGGEKVYEIPCTWMSWGVVRIKAESLEKAIEKASLASLPLCR